MYITDEEAYSTDPFGHMIISNFVLVIMYRPITLFSDK